VQQQQQQQRAAQTDRQKATEMSPKVKSKHAQTASPTQLLMHCDIDDEDSSVNVARKPSRDRYKTDKPLHHRMPAGGRDGSSRKGQEQDGHGANNSRHLYYQGHKQQTQASLKSSAPVLQNSSPTTPMQQQSPQQQVTSAQEETRVATEGHVTHGMLSDSRRTVEQIIPRKR
jgi:hypothetical protein